MTRRILIIDDDLAIAQMVKISLQAVAGWDVIIANSGEEGLTMAAAELPDAILLDWMMPEMDGLATFKKMQADSVTRNIPVIFLTAKINPGQESPFADLPIAGMIGKPFKAPHLVSQIQSILNWNC